MALHSAPERRCPPVNWRLGRPPVSLAKDQYTDSITWEQVRVGDILVKPGHHVVIVRSVGTGSGLVKEIGAIEAVGQSEDGSWHNEVTDARHYTGRKWQYLKYVPRRLRP